MSLKKLPTNNGYTIHQILVPSLGKKFRFRPFLVKENKALMVAQGSGDPNQILDTMRAIIESCCVEKDGIDGDKLATFDFEWLMVKLRSISIDDKITVNVICDDPHEGRSPETRKQQLLVDLDNVELVDIDKYNPRVELSKNLVVMIDKIYSDEEVYDMSEYSDEDIVDWISNLTESQFDKLFAYFDHIPYCRLVIEWTCPVCGKKNIRTVEGTENFF